MPANDLRELARSHGVQVEYVDSSGRLKPATTASLLGALRALGVDLSSEAKARRALRERRLALWRRRIEPVVVVWEGNLATADVRIRAHRGSAVLGCRLLTREPAVVGDRRGGRRLNAPGREEQGHPLT